MIFQKVNQFRGEITVPGDKSISHRAVMFGALSTGTTEVEHFLQGADCLSTISCFRQMGIEIENNQDAIHPCVRIHGKGLHGLSKPSYILDVGNSGTTMRLMSGILCGQTFATTVTGDASIQKRPMKRIITPLSLMGADIKSEKDNNCAPLLIQPVSKLHGIHYTSPVASAQVKSSILLAGLYADSETTVTEPYLSRNHSELMLRSFGAKIECKDSTTIIQPEPTLTAQYVIVPGDISSATYFIAAGLMLPNAEVVIRNVGINPTRDGILRVCKAMGGNVKLENVKETSGELTADLIVTTSSLHGTTIEGGLIPTLIDEIPMIAILACFAKGTTVIRNAEELKVKESNRLEVIVTNLKKMGADLTATEDGMIIEGGKPLHGAVIDSKMDHRIAMSFAIAGLASSGETEILDAECVNISYPNFYSDLARLYR